MRKLLILICLAVPVLAQNPPAYPPTTTSDPTGKACAPNAVLNYIPSGQLFTCDAGVYKASGGGSSAPGAPANSIQKNNAGSFGASNSLDDGTLIQIMNQAPSGGNCPGLRVIGSAESGAGYGGAWMLGCNPPPVVSLTSSAGGTLANGTYYYLVTDGTDQTLQQPQGATVNWSESLPSNIVTVTVTSSANATQTIKWNDGSPLISNSVMQIFVYRCQAPADCSATPAGYANYASIGQSNATNASTGFVDNGIAAGTNGPPTTYDGSFNMGCYPAEGGFNPYCATTVPGGPNGDQIVGDSCHAWDGSSDSWDYNFVTKSGQMFCNSTTPTDWATQWYTGSDKAQLTCGSGTVATCAMDIIPVATTISGTAGSAICSMSMQGTLKTATCYLNAYQRTSTAQTFSYPTAFSTTPVLLESGGSCGTFNPTTTSSTLTLPANAAMTAETCNIVAMGQ